MPKEMYSNNLSFDRIDYFIRLYKNKSVFMLFIGEQPFNASCQRMLF
jgi:hypothetical protein